MADLESKLVRALSGIHQRRITIRLTSLVIVQLVLFALFVFAGPRLVRGMAEPSRKATGAGANDSLGIAKLTRAVKHDLETLEKERLKNKQAGLLRLRDFELEISFVVQTTDRASGGVDYEVITADTERTYSSEQVQRLTLRFDAAEDTPGVTPLDPDNTSQTKDAVVHGQVPPDQLPQKP